jgi:hypothetical protein
MYFIETTKVPLSLVLHLQFWPSVHLFAYKLHFKTLLQHSFSKHTNHFNKREIGELCRYKSVTREHSHYLIDLELSTYTFNRQVAVQTMYTPNDHTHRFRRQGHVVVGG